MHSVLLAARGVAAVAAGRHDDACAILRRAFDPGDPGHHYREQFGALSYFAEAAAQCGRADEARDVLAGVAVTPAAAPALHEAVRFAHALLDGDADAPLGSARDFDRAACGSRERAGSCGRGGPRRRGGCSCSLKGISPERGRPPGARRSTPRSTTSEQRQGVVKTVPRMAERGGVVGPQRDVEAIHGRAGRIRRLPRPQVGAGRRERVEQRAHSSDATVDAG